MQGFACVAQELPAVMLNLVIVVLMACALVMVASCASPGSWIAEHRTENYVFPRGGGGGGGGNGG